MFIKISEVLNSRITAMNSEDKKLGEKLVKKLNEFTHAPLNKKHGLRMLPFIESKELVNLVADIIKSHELKFFGNNDPASIISDYDVKGYYYCIDLLVLYVVNQKDNYENIISILANEIEKENEFERIKNGRGGESYNVMLRIFEFYKKDTNALDELILKIKKY